MGLSATIANAAASAKSATLDVWQDVTFSTVTKGTYNPATGATGDTTSSQSVKAVISPYSVSQVDGVHVEAGDIKALVLQGEFTGTPTVQDGLTYGGDAYRVVGVSKDPANATWAIQCRRAS